MADNFLEKQMEQYRCGRTVVRHLNPSLDLLLHKLAEQDACGEELKAETDPALIIRSAQLEAALRSARIAFPEGFQAEVSEENQSIVIDETSCGNELGGIVLAIRLKAAELGLDTAATHTGGKRTAILFGRNRR